VWRVAGRERPTSEHGGLARLGLACGTDMRGSGRGGGGRTEQEHLDGLFAFLELFPGLFDGIVDLPGYPGGLLLLCDAGLFFVVGLVLGGLENGGPGVVLDRLVEGASRIHNHGCAAT
jgi:hypothetical protein